jgi:hypothetical protein
MPAYLDRDTAELRPPSKHILFNPHIVQSDGLLCSHVADRMQITYEEGTVMVQRFVSEQLQRLEKSGELSWARLGRFVMKNGEIQFTQHNSINYLPEAYGLTQLELSSIDRVKLLETQEGDASTNSIVETSNPNKRGWLRYAAVGLIAIGISSVLGYGIYQDSVERHQIAVEQLAEQKMRDKIAAETVSVASPLPPLTIRAVPREEPEIDRYHLIAGAFREEANAEKKVAQLSEEGYAASRVGMNKYGLHTVAISSHATRAEAVQALRELRSTKHDGVWLFIEAEQ